MADAQQPYWDAMEAFNEAVTARQYDRALTELKKGLRATAKAVHAMKSDFGIPPSIPFIESKAGAMAALFDDDETYRLMSEVSALPDLKEHGEDETPKYRRDGEIIAAIRQHVAAHTTTSMTALRGLVQPDETRGLTRLAQWMEKHGEISMLKAGKDWTITKR